MTKLAVSPDFMPRVVEDFLRNLVAIKQLLQRAYDATTPDTVIDAYKTGKRALAGLQAIESAHTLSGLKPYLENHTNVADWSIYLPEYIDLTTNSLPAFLTAVENNISILTVQSIGGGDITWQPLNAAEITTMRSLLSAALVNFE